MFGLKADGALTQEPLFLKNARTDPDGKTKHPGQGVGPIHVHPNGRFVYQTNRGSGMTEVARRTRSPMAGKTTWWCRAINDEQRRADPDPARLDRQL